MGMGMPPISGSRLFGGQYGGVGTSSVGGLASIEEVAATASNTSSLFNPEEFYESILIDSILGDDQDLLMRGIAGGSGGGSSRY